LAESGEKQDDGKAEHEEREKKVRRGIRPANDVPDAHKRVTHLRNNAHQYGEREVPIHVARCTKEHSRHREIEDASDLNLPDVHGRPGWGRVKEPAGERKARDTDDEMNQAPSSEEENDYPGSLKHAVDSVNAPMYATLPNG
jgi:hypothetical protein